LFNDLGAHEFALFEEQREQVDPRGGFRRVVTRTEKRRGVTLGGTLFQKSNHRRLNLFNQVSQNFFFEVCSVSGEHGELEPML
jgi:hypothetical protein